jgi:hypothetical protein
MKTNPPLTPEQAERLREHYRKCAFEVILLPPEALADECPEFVARTLALREARRVANARLAVTEEHYSPPISSASHDFPLA